MDGPQNKKEKGKRRNKILNFTGGKKREEKFVNIILRFSINFLLKVFVVDCYSIFVHLYNYHQFVQIND
jgi:hypothetical protein